MDGIDATTGGQLGGLAHLRQSIRDILGTSPGSRVMLREYGCNLRRRIDAPMNRQTMLDIVSDVAVALKRWEPRFKLTSCQIVEAEPGRAVLDLVGIYVPDGKEITLDGIEIK